MFCGSCGKEVKNDAAFCPNCGTKTGAAGNPAPQQQEQASAYQQVQQPKMYAQAGSTAKSTSGWQHFCTVVKKYAVFQGRARRAEYWYYALFYTLFYILLIIIDYAAVLMITESNSLLLRWIRFLCVLIYLAFFLPSLGVLVRRLHDVDRRGWWCLVPIYGLVLLFYAGTPGPNRFGADPKQAQ